MESKLKMKIGFVGNCQANALCWYFRNLLQSDFYWVDGVFGGKNHPYINNQNRFLDQTKFNIFDHEIGIKYLKSCDVIIYQKIRPERNAYFNYLKIEKEYSNENTKLISFPHIFFNEEIGDYKEMAIREEKNNVSIRASEIIKNNKKHQLMVRGIKNHDYPTAFFFIEIIKAILNILDIQLDAKTYSHYLKLGYPFEKYEYNL